MGLIQGQCKRFSSEQFFCGTNCTDSFHLDICVCMGKYHMNISGGGPVIWIFLCHVLTVLIWIYVFVDEFLTKSYKINQIWMKFQNFNLIAVHHSSDRRDLCEDNFAGSGLNASKSSWTFFEGPPDHGPHWHVWVNDHYSYNPLTFCVHEREKRWVEYRLYSWIHSSDSYEKHIPTSPFFQEWRHLLVSIKLCSSQILGVIPKLEKLR